MQLSDFHLTRIAHAIARVSDVAAVVVFGSQARGDAGENSDLDLLVIRQGGFRPGESRRRELGRVYRAATDVCPIPKDILLFTAAELQEWRHTTNHLVSEAMKDGRVIYGEI